ncbi:MAG: nucleoside triphosphate hydrolase, partial [Bradyrhizobium sp.]|nr:nucleoside triphosphate hydrolase [Bradyrhizobium sp.]
MSNDAHVRFLSELLERAADAGGRFLVGIAGVPGSGKSTLAARWAEFGRREFGANVMVLPMDGFHYRNDYLDAHEVECAGVLRPLRERKGSPESFDVSALMEAMRRLKAGERLCWPTYDRVIHDPVSGKDALPAAGVFFIEGNYLLLDEPIWRGIAALLDVRVFLDVDIELALGAVGERHMRGGK